MKRPFTKKDARKIARKLGATIDKRRTAHDRAIVCFEGRKVAEFGIRRGTGDLPHNFLPNELELRREETFKLAQCEMSKEAYFALWCEKNPECPE